VSDVDVVFVAGPDDVGARASTAVATHMMRAVSAHTAAGTIWQVDAALRPEGKSGPLVRTLDSFRSYYERWAKTWEFQAMLKARPAAGDLALGGRLVDTVGPMVWQAADRPGFVEDAQAMRRRVVEHLGDDPEREIKLGPGGLRDVEFAVQLLQLVHGRTDESLRSPTTLTALDALTDGGYIGRDDGAALADAYRFLRALEHRLQLYRLQRTHVLPSDEVSLRRIGRSMGFFESPVEQLGRVWTTTRTPSAGCTRSCSIAPCWPRSRASPAKSPGSPRRQPSNV
jgi:glutamate-ammonia-ligase adenylyltransferase